LGTAAAAEAPAAGQHDKNQLTPALEPHQGTGYQLARTAPLLNIGRPSVLWGVSWFPLGPPAGGHTEPGVDTSALYECGSGASRRRALAALRGPGLCGNPTGEKQRRNIPEVSS
jgi:hypothetical protein